METGRGCRGGLRLVCGLRSGGGDGRGDGLLGAGDAERPVIDAEGPVFLLHFGLELMHLAQGFESGLQEAGNGGNLAVVDVGMGEGAGGGIEVFEDGGVVFHADELDEGGGGPGVGIAGPDFGVAEAAVVVEAEIFAAEGGGGTAGAVEFEVTAAGPVEVHWVSPEADRGCVGKGKAQPGRLGFYFFFHLSSGYQAGRIRVPNMFPGFGLEVVWNQ